MRFLPRPTKPANSTYTGPTSRYLWREPWESPIFAASKSAVAQMPPFSFPDTKPAKDFRKHVIRSGLPYDPT
jgi:hypothetical protein